MNNVKRFFAILSLLVAISFTLVISAENNIDKSMGVKTCYEEEIFSKRDKCLINMALVENDISMCRRISSMNSKAFCVAKISYKSPDSKECERLENKNLIKLCNAYAKKSFLSCGSISDDPLADICYLKTMSPKKHSALCEQIKNQDLASYCNTVVDLAKQGFSIRYEDCSFSKDQETYNQCVGKIQSIVQKVSYSHSNTLIARVDMYFKNNAPEYLLRVGMFTFLCIFFFLTFVFGAMAKSYYNRRQKEKKNKFRARKLSEVLSKQHDKLQNERKQFKSIMEEDDDEEEI